MRSTSLWYVLFFIPQIVHIRDPLGRDFSTRLSNVFVVGDGGKPWVSMPKGGGIKLTITEEVRLFAFRLARLAMAMY